MKKIGLLLTAEPSDGGMFQYNLMILDAIAALPRDEYAVVAGYTSSVWIDYLEKYSVQKIFVPKGFVSRFIETSWRKMGLPLRIWSAMAPYFHPGVKKIVQEQCDVWICPTQDRWSYQIPVAALFTIHDLMHRYESQFPEVSAHGEYCQRERLLREICRKAIGILVDSQVGKHHVQESYGIDADRLFVLSYTAPQYMYSTEDHRPIGLRYNLPPKYIFYPAQFWEHKNHAGLLKAIARLKDTVPDLKLVLVGSNKNAYDRIMGIIRKLDLGARIMILGYVPESDMPALYRCARALVMPTFLGPTNIPALEAFVAGCPVAVSDIYGIPEQVGDAALLFNPGSEAEIAECIKKLWFDDDLCAELAKKGKKRASLWGQKQFNERFKMIIDKTCQQH